MEKEFVVYNAVRMIKGWPEKIEAAQTVPAYSIDGTEYPRIPYGGESGDWGADRQPCHDCAVIKGQYHVTGCDVEQCPACGEQVLSCDCEHDDAN